MMGNQYGPYVMYILSQLLKRKQAEPEENEVHTEEKIFGRDETGAEWSRQTNLELLRHFCREGYAQAVKHGHFLTGRAADGDYIAIPGRFLLEDQPAGGRTGFTLWQPLAGGEEHYTCLEDMEEESARHIYGYWIAALDSRTLEISEA